MDVVGVGGDGSLLLVHMIDIPHPLNTHRRSSSYIYKVFQHLLQRLQVIRMLPHPDICPLGPESGCCRQCQCGRWVLLVLMFKAPHSHQTHIRSSLYI
jgi:hypothetical protein